MHVLAVAAAALLATSVAAGTATPSPSPAGPAPPSAPPAPVPLLEWDVVSRRPHDRTAFTQGLVFDDSGRLFESTGLNGGSSVREVDPATGEVLRSRAQPTKHFAEGLAVVDDELVQLTWLSGIARRFDADTFEIVRRYRYDGQGWGLCSDGGRLVMSDGSARLTFRDAQTFEPLGSVTVTLAGEPLVRLNELECVDGAVWANVWMTDAIVRIDPTDGQVTGVLDLAGIIAPDPAVADPGAVLNGIAYDDTSDTFLVTGKRWPELIEIRVTEAS